MQEQHGSPSDHTSINPVPTRHPDSSPIIDPSWHVPEILAPAGGRAQFFAALNSGADAVFLGLQSFNARARATNFSVEDLRELVPVAHSFGMKVLVTVNILIKETELPQLFETLAGIEQAGADAVIVQDLAVARIVKEYFPALRLHASTQMAVHNAAGVIEAANFGFRRVVLARELTQQEIRRIRQEVPRELAELEAFCHGSLCYSYSGLCFFSGAGDARSGNRGECAYTCRQPYKIINEPGHGFLFSMRDFDTSLSLDLLVKAGVDTLKIEGRKKDAQYVATSVKLYRKSLNRIFGRDTLRNEAPVNARAYVEDKAPVEIDQEFTFRRRPTTFFLKSRYQENVIDLDNPTHKGLALGTVLSATKTSVTFRTAHDLELYDGLRIDQSGKVYHSKPQDGDRLQNDVSLSIDRYENKHTEFSVRSIHIGGKKKPLAKAGDIVTVEVPDLSDAPQKGSAIFKVRSVALKNRIERLSQLPPDIRLQQHDRITLAINAASCDQGGVALEVRGKSGSFDLELPPFLLPEAERPKGASRFADDLEDAISVFGEAGIICEQLHFTGDTNWFYPRSLLKKFKATLGEALRTEIERMRNERALRWGKYLTALNKIDDHSRHSEHGSCHLERSEEPGLNFVIKTDRKETALAALAASFGTSKLSEIVFEPKRAFIGNEQAGDVIAEILSACQANGVTLRIAVPTVVRAWDEPLLSRWMKHSYDLGIHHFEVGNIGGPGLLRKWLGTSDLNLSADFTLYTLNSAARQSCVDIGVSQTTLSVEDDLANITEQIRTLTPEDRSRTTAILFKDTPLFIAEACSLTALHNGCPTAAVCGYRTLEIENKDGERFFVAHESCKSIVYGKDAFSITQHKDELSKLGIQSFRLDFLTRPYTTDALEGVIRAATTGYAVPGTHTANFNRTLL